MRPVYVPILRAKQGEIEALGCLSPRARVLARPLLDLPRSEVESPQELENRIADTLWHLAQTWGTAEPLYIDLLRYPPTATVSSGMSAQEFLFSCAKQYRLAAIPVTGPESDRGPGQQYLEAIARTVERDQRGVAIRLLHDAFLLPTQLDPLLDSLLAALRVATSQVDLILDVESLALVTDEDKAALPDMLSDVISILAQRNFRSIIVSASSIPETPRRRVQNPLRFPRLELSIWEELVQRHDLTTIMFSDYGVVYPRETDPDGPVIVPSRVRVTTPLEQVFFKSPRGTYSTLCNDVLSSKDFQASVPSWGSNAIRECAAGIGSEGNATTWVARDTNAHIETTVQTVEGILSRLNRLPSVAEIAQQPWLQALLFDR